MMEIISKLKQHKLYKLAMSHKEFRYLISGGLSEALEFFSFIFLLHFIDLLYLSNSISYALGVISGFYLHKTLSFPGEQQFKTQHQLIGYASLATINFFLINILVGALVFHLHWAPFVAKFVAIAVIAIWSFTWSNFVVFKHKKPVS